MGPVHQSPLLQCLSQLNDDAWAQVLLPKLVNQGSAPDVAASCTQLRALCFRTVQDVVLQGTSEVDVSTIDDWMSPLPACFPNCTTLALYLDCQRDYINVPHLPTACTSQLDDLRLNTTTTAEPMGMAMLLGSMRTSLTSLQGLTWEVRQPWQQAEDVWQELALYTQLTDLKMTYNMSGGSSFELAELAPLSRLGSLQCLKLAPDKMLPWVLPAYTAGAEDGNWLQCLAGMTALTELLVQVPQLGGLHYVSSCSRLEDIEVFSYQSGTALGDADWEAIAQLTRLTRLLVETQGGAAAPASCYAASRKPQASAAGRGLWVDRRRPACAADADLLDYDLR